LHDADEAVRAMITIIDEERSLDFDIRSGHTPDPETEQEYERMRNDAGQFRNIDLGNGRTLYAMPVTGANTINKVNDGDSDGQRSSSRQKGYVRQKTEQRKDESMSKRSKSMPVPCPFCGGDIRIGVTDAEGNPKSDDYELNPWSGLRFVILHPEKPGMVCPINTFGEESVGACSYDFRKIAIKVWNTRTEKKV